MREAPASEAWGTPNKLAKDEETDHFWRQQTQERGGARHPAKSGAVI
jgi:hypothetical protein